jgi:hypothetical protein
MATFDVTLYSTKPLIFPPRCVVCEAKNPDGLIRLSILGAKTPSYLKMAVDKALDLDADPKYYGSNTLNKIEGIPACKGCESGLKRYHRLLKFAYYTAWIPGLMPLVFFMRRKLSVFRFNNLCRFAWDIHVDISAVIRCDFF